MFFLWLFSYGVCSSKIKTFEVQRPISNANNQISSRLSEPLCYRSILKVNKFIYGRVLKCVNSLFNREKRSEARATCKQLSSVYHRLHQLQIVEGGTGSCGYGIMLAVMAVNLGEAASSSQLAHCYVMLALQLKQSLPSLLQFMSRCELFICFQSLLTVHKLVFDKVVSNLAVKTYIILWKIKHSKKVRLRFDIKKIFEYLRFRYLFTIFCNINTIKHCTCVGIIRHNHIHTHDL